MKPRCGQREAGYLLIESVVLGMIALAAAAALVIFARGAVLAQQSAARDGTVYAARECLSTLEAQLDHEGQMLLPKVEEWTRGAAVYTVTAEERQQGDFHDITVHVSWTFLGDRDTISFQRRMRRHESLAGGS